jgi:crotonobetaine/carnitine-CoA ligase
VTPAPLAAPSVGHLLRARAERHPTARFLEFETRQLTFRAVDERSNQIAGLLRRWGIAPGDRVAVMLPNGLEFPVIWLGLAKAGAVMVPVNTQYRAHDLAYTLADSGARLALVDPALESRVNEVRPRCPALREIVRVERGAVVQATTSGFATELDAAPVSPQPIPVGPDHLLNIQYTSGTTGDPKGCMLTHEYWLRMFDGAARYAQMTEADVALTAQPFYYLDPQWNVGLCLIAGCSLVILPRFSATTFWRSVTEAKATFVYLLGTMPVFLLKQPPDPAVERAHTLRFVACSGIVPQLHAEFEARWGVPWREAFGMTETGVDLAVPIEETSSVGSGAAGRPVIGKEAKVVGPRGESLGDDQVGELCLRGPGMMRGYWNNPEATADRLRDGWMHTGDLAFRDRGGSYHIVGRVKDMIRRTGENISAVEVEGVLAQHPAVRGAAVVAVPDELRGEEVKAFLQLQPDQPTVDPAEILAFARDRLAAFKVPRFLEYVTDFPRTPSERIAKHVLLAGKADQRRGAYDATTGAWG